MQNIVLMTGLEPPGPFAAPGPSNLCTITARSTRSVRACLRASSCWKLPVASFQRSAKKARPPPSSHVAGPLAPPRGHARARARRAAATGRGLFDYSAPYVYGVAPLITGRPLEGSANITIYAWSATHRSHNPRLFARARRLTAA